MTRRFLHGRLCADTRGAAITEFGLLLVPLCLVLMGSLDMGFQMYYRSQLQGALNDVARASVVETPAMVAAGSTLDERIDESIRQRVNTLVRGATYTITKSNYYQFSRIGRPEKLVTDVDGDGAYDTGDCYEDENGNGSYDTSAARTGRGGADDIVIYQVRIVAPRLLPAAGLFGVSPNYDITARTAVRNQPYANQARPPVVC